jgi:NADPH-dependent 2,4-dienoyl-CoA reductase/sulfur reductase-like enzyme
MMHDPRSVSGKTLDISGHCSLLVIGAGPAGLAAAIEAASQGVSVTLVDENPVPFETMSESVPLFYGQRMSGAVRNRNAMMEQMLESRPDLVTAFELGIDVRLGTACWGLFLNSENMRWMDRPVAGLADEENGSSLVTFDRAIVATGRRDMGLAFPGWDQPGVMGAAAAIALTGQYKALDGRRAVILGSTADAMMAALDLAATGVEIACLIEQADAPVGPADLLARLSTQSIEVKCNNCVQSVVAGRDGVEGVTIEGGHLDCDLVVIGVGAVPMIDLLAAAGCRVSYDNARGGFVPDLDEQLCSSFPQLQVVGDCAGIWAGKSMDPAIAETEGRFAARYAAQMLGPTVEPAENTLVVSRPQPEQAFDIGAYRKAWVQRSVLDAESEPHVCQCEEVSAREILEVRPPRYLEWQASDNKARTLPDLLGEAPPDPDQIKRLTRAGMGPCQGRRCREQIQALLALKSELPLAAIPLAGYRAPVRPMPLKTAAPAVEDAAIAAQWDSWFGMPRQWTPFWDVEDFYTVSSLDTEKPHVSE